MSSKEKNTKNKYIHSRLFQILLIVLILLGGIFTFLFITYKSVSVHAQILGSNHFFLSPQKLSQLYQDQLKKFFQASIILTDGEHIQEVALEKLGISWDQPATENGIHEISQSKNIFGKLTQTYTGKPVILIDDTILKTTLQEHFPVLQAAPKDAEVILEVKDFIIHPEASGNSIDYDAFKQALLKRVETQSLEKIPFTISKKEPVITQKIAENALEYAKDLSLKTIIYEDPATHKTWKIFLNDHKDWFLFRPEKDSILVRLSNDKLAEYLQEHVLKTIEAPKQDITIEYKDGKVEKVTGIGKNGYRVSIDETLQKTHENILNKIYQIELSAYTDKAVVIQNENPLGITEIIGEGTSNFKGSPANRIHNIKRGIRDFQNLVIAPNEELSVLKVLGNIDQANGYLPELVIKGVDLKPEWGGGLCQVSTTIYRSAFYTGLSITDWGNHSRVISYYNPIGLDATIYSPSTDFRFVNDTAHSILIQNEIDVSTGNLTFRIWGTSDGRKVETSTSGAYDWTGVPSPIYEKVTTLQPGVKKLKAHGSSGVKADWFRTVTYTDDRPVKSETFKARYRAVPAIYLIGADGAETPTPVEEIPPEAAVE